MKRLILIYLLSSMVVANSGYLPITIFNGKTYSYAYCEIGKPCKYLNNQTTGNKISTSNNNSSPILYIIGGILMAILISVGIISLFLKWLKY